MLQQIQKSIFTKPIIGILIIALFNLSFISPNEKVILKAGTPLQLELVNIVDTKTIQPGQIVDFRVKFDIKANNKVVIPAGAIAKGQVVRADKAKGIGKPGEIQIEIKSVSAVDGSQVYLSNGTIYREGEDKQTLSIVLGIFVCVLCLLIKGKNAKIFPGSEFNVQVATNAEIEVSK